MSRDSSPPPLSDDSALGSSSSCVINNDRNVTSNGQDPSRNNDVQSWTQPKSAASTSKKSKSHHTTSSNNINNKTISEVATILKSTDNMASTTSPTKPVKVTRPTAKDLIVDENELILAAKLMRQNNCSLIVKSIRTNLPCFDDLEVHKFEAKTTFLINFISNGINNCTSSILRPVSILWPDSYDQMVDKLAYLDAYLLNTSFREKPVDWMLGRGLITIPSCRQCKNKMTLRYDTNTVRWLCSQTSACSNYFMPIQRPSFFYSYENIGLDKLLFSVYYWSTCIPGEELYSRMNIQPQVLDGIWKKLQNICRTALDKSYPRYRLTNMIDEGPETQGPAQPIDLISVKLNDVYIVCAKHPASNLVRLGIYIPKISQYSFSDLTESWFAHGANVRISENKFLELTKKRTDLKIDLVSRLDMMSKDGQFHRESAFGYIVCQLSHVLKDFDSSTLSRESLKLVLAELEWRELYGTTPYDAFSNIISHMSQYGEVSDWYSEPSLPINGEETSDKLGDKINRTLDICEYVWAEKYFYATVDPVDSEGKVICRLTEPPNLEKEPEPDVRVQCHECELRFDCFDFAIHMTTHVEKNRREQERSEYMKRSLIECKHCFKTFKKHDIEAHSRLFSSHYHQIRFGCRICCVLLANRSEFLQHMRKVHFEHETPYRCPSCKFSSSFQRDVFIHFQEEHKHSMVLLCPLCLRSFTVANPDSMNPDRARELSKMVYNHIAEHYVTSKKFTCTNCSLCFTDRERLIRHKKLHHNPLQTHGSKNIKLSPFVVTREEEEYCVKALQSELFIANKRPNLTVDPSDVTKEQHQEEKLSRNERNDYSTSDSSESEDSFKSWSSSEEDDSFGQPEEGGFVHLRNYNAAKKFLTGGEPTLRIPKHKTVTTKANASGKSDIQWTECSAGRIINYMSKLKRADGIIPNRSVILTPRSKPAKCCECLEFVTVDHFSSSIICARCKHVTYCPRAATNHQKTKHS